MGPLKDFGWRISKTHSRVELILELKLNSSRLPVDSTSFDEVVVSAAFEMIPSGRVIFWTSF